MTYSHNSVRNNIKMTAASAATKTIRLKNGIANGGGFSNSPSPTTSSSPVTAHSNSIAISTNYYNHNHNQQQQQQQQQSASPPPCSMSSNASTCSSTSSLGSTGNGGYFSSRSRQQQQQRAQRSQRQSPQQLFNVGTGSGGGGAFMHHHHHAGNKRSGAGGSAHKNRDSPRTPNSVVRHSPAVILGGGIPTTTAGFLNISVGSSCSTTSSASSTATTGSSGRKQRKSPLNFNGGKTSPSLIPTAQTHFAGSKCFDAPAPTALPKPPHHWTSFSNTDDDIVADTEKLTSSAGLGLQNVLQFTTKNARPHSGSIVKSSKRNLLDEFDTHNLKILLNVQS